MRLPFPAQTSRLALRAAGLAASVVLTAPVVGAQANYEIQVYGADLVPVGKTMFELHTNFTANGSKSASGGMYATHRAVHETVEITHGFNEWYETGFYLFISQRGPEGAQLVGTHIRPRFSVPERFHLPVGLSLSQEIGYQRKEFSEDTWSWEIRPIIDQKLGRFYWSLNPVIGKALRGPNAGAGFDFSPNVQVNFDVTGRVNVALEYYGGYGSLRKFDPLSQTSQQLFPAINLDFGEDWEFNAGIGFGLTSPTDKLIGKLILGRRIGGNR